MEGDILSIGPCLLSAETIRRENRRQADANGGYRWLAVIPFVFVAFSIFGLGVLENSVRAGIIVIPQVALLFGVLLFKSYRPIRYVECRIVLGASELQLESRVDRRRPARLIVHWKDIVGIEDDDEGLLLHIRSNHPVRIFAECLTNPLHREMLMAHAHASSLPA